MKSDVDALWDFADAAASERRFADALAACGPQDQHRRAELLTQIARARGLQQRFDHGHAALSQARELAPSGEQRLQARIALEHGRLLRSAGNAGASCEHFQHAWELAQGVDDWLAVDAAHMLALVTRGDESLDWHRHALELSTTSEDPDAQPWRASLLNNLAWLYHEQGRFAEALEHFREALKEREAAGREREILIARWSCARCLRSLGRVEEALGSQLELAAAHERAGSEDGFVSEEIGECLLLLGRPAEAPPYFAEAYRLLSRDAWLSRDEPQRLERLRKLGQSASS